MRLRTSSRIQVGIKCAKLFTNSRSSHSTDVSRNHLLLCVNSSSKGPDRLSFQNKATLGRVDGQRVDIEVARRAAKSSAVLALCDETASIAAWWSPARVAWIIGVVAAN